MSTTLEPFPAPERMRHLPPSVFAWLISLVADADVLRAAVARMAEAADYSRKR